MGSVTKRMDLVAARKYTKRDGTEKTQWINIGEVVQWDDGGMSGKLATIPVGNWWDGTFKVFEQKEREGSAPRSQGGTRSSAPAPSNSFDDDGDSVPF